MSEDERIEEILNTIQKIKESKISVTDYFKQNEVPFSRAQYYNYCKTIQKYGEEGLKDYRTRIVMMIKICYDFYPKLS